MSQILAKKYNALSYIEILIVIGMLAVASALMLPITITELGSQRVAFHANNVVTLAFAAQQDAFSQIGGSAHGIRFNTDSYDVYDGSSYATATFSYNVELPEGLEFTSIDLTNPSSNPTTEYVVDRGNLKPDSKGTVTISDGAKTYRITLNEEGAIYYEII